MEAYEIAVIGGGMLDIAIDWGCATRGGGAAAPRVPHPFRARDALRPMAPECDVPVAELPPVRFQQKAAA